jgi:predicted nucleic acid-binding protein
MTGLPAYMLDTNVFNGLVRGDYSLSIFSNHRLVATGIQRDELNNTPDAEKRARLLGRFDSIRPDVLPAASFAFGIEGAGWDQAMWKDGSGNIDRMRHRRQQLDRRPRPLNQERDILIAETAIKAGAVLVTGDANLRRVTEEFGGQALNPAALQP